MCASPGSERKKSISFAVRNAGVPGKPCSFSQNELTEFAKQFASGVLPTPSTPAHTTAFVLMLGRIGNTKFTRAKFVKSFSVNG
eukprot:22694-Amphidinium_carterae.1